MPPRRLTAECGCTISFAAGSKQGEVVKFCPEYAQECEVSAVEAGWPKGLFLQRIQGQMVDWGIPHSTSRIKPIVKTVSYPGPNYAV